MKNSKSVSAIILFVLAIGFGACSQDEHMDEIMAKTEINQPSTTNPNEAENSEQTDDPDGN